MKPDKKVLDPESGLTTLLIKKDFLNFIKIHYNITTLIKGGF